MHGARQTLKNVYSGALRIFTLQLLLGEPLTIFEDGLQLRDYVSVKDVASANVLAMESQKSDFEVYNVGGGVGYTVIDLGKMIADELKIKISNFSGNGDYRVGDIRNAVSSIKKLKRLGWKIRISEKESIKEFIKWVKATGNINRTHLKKTSSDMAKLGVLVSSQSSGK